MLPNGMKDLYLPKATQPERFVRGRPIKGRNEPSAIGGVAWVVHKVMERGSFEEIAQKAWVNTITLFRLHVLD